VSHAARIVAAAAEGPQAVDAALAAAPDPANPELVAVAVAARAVAEQLAAARHDPLTGLPHRGALAEAPTADAVLAIDVDGLKGVNDTRGHDAGDTVLAAVAQALRGSLRRGDTVFRTGGDEFVAQLAGADAPAAAVAAERLRAAVAAATSVTVSIGIAVRRPDEAPERTRARADAALYAAKSAGRDRVAHAGNDA
jgi:diguanylate cyclase (GGDEF)-like protein